MYAMKRPSWDQIGCGQIRLPLRTAVGLHEVDLSVPNEGDAIRVGGSAIAASATSAAESGCHEGGDTHRLHAQMLSSVPSEVQRSRRTPTLARFPDSSGGLSAVEGMTARSLFSGRTAYDQGGFRREMRTRTRRNAIAALFVLVVAGIGAVVQPAATREAATIPPEELRSYPPILVLWGERQHVTYTATGDVYLVQPDGAASAAC